MRDGERARAFGERAATGGSRSPHDARVALESVWGRLVEAFGFREVREVSISEVERYIVRWADAPPIADCVRAALGVKQPESTGSAEMQLPMTTELTQAEYDALVAGMRANAETYGRRRN